LKFFGVEIFWRSKGRAPKKILESKFFGAPKEERQKISTLEGCINWKSVHALFLWQYVLQWVAVF